MEATFGFIDLAGFTALTEAHGDEEAVALVGRFESLAASAMSAGDRHLTTPVELFDLALSPSFAGSAIDPVCRMQVSRNDAAGRLRYADTDYWFCSLRCAAVFAAAPDRYADSGGA